MGIYRSTPLTDKNTETHKDDFITYAACGMQGKHFSLNLFINCKGWRVSMEDSHIANLDLGGNKYLFGVFDGHGGIIHIYKSIKISRYGGF